MKINVWFSMVMKITKTLPTCTFKILHNKILYLTFSPNLSCTCKIIVCFSFNIDLCCDDTRGNVLCNLLLIFYLYARTAKVLSFWIKFRTILTSWGLKSWRGNVCPGIRIIITCGRTGITWQLSSSCKVLPWNSSMSEPRYYLRTYIGTVSG